MKKLVLLMAVLSSFQVFAVVAMADEPASVSASINLQDLMLYPNDVD